MEVFAQELRSTPNVPRDQWPRMFPITANLIEWVGRQGKAVDADFLMTAMELCTTILQTSDLAQHLWCHLGSVPMVLRVIGGLNAHEPEVDITALRFACQLLNEGDDLAQSHMYQALRTNGVFLRGASKFFEGLTADLQNHNVDNAISFRSSMERNPSFKGMDEPSSHYSLQLDLLKASVLARLLQLTCEGHNTQMQDLLREQVECAESYNLVANMKTALMRVSSRLSPFTIGYAYFLLETLIEVCQGPNTKNQDICCSKPFMRSIASLLQNPCSSCLHVEEDRMKGAAVRLLLALLEGGLAASRSKVIVEAIKIEDLLHRLRRLREKVEANANSSALGVVSWRTALIDTLSSVPEIFQLTSCNSRGSLADVFRFGARRTSSNRQQRRKQRETMLKRPALQQKWLPLLQEVSSNGTPAHKVQAYQLLLLPTCHPQKRSLQTCTRTRFRCLHCSQLLRKTNAHGGMKGRMSTKRTLWRF